MKLYFKITPPNFALTDKGKFSLAQLDEDDFEQYCKSYIQAIKERRKEQMDKIPKIKSRGMHYGN